MSAFAVTAHPRRKPRRSRNWCAMHLGESMDALFAWAGDLIARGKDNSAPWHLWEDREVA